MRKTAMTMALGMMCAAVTSQAAITWGPFTETDTTLSGSAEWTGSPGAETAATTTPGGNWWVQVTFATTAKSYSIVLDGQHLVAPHPSDIAPSEVVELGVLFTKAIGNGVADGSLFHNPGASSGHTDTWHLDAKADSVVGATFTATHSIPEPGTYALLAGLGLLGFAGFRRMKR